MPMPAVMFTNRTVHSSQNCGVFIAVLTRTLFWETFFFCFCAAGSKPAGFQSGAGTRTIKAEKSIIHR